MNTARDVRAAFLLIRADTYKIPERFLAPLGTALKKLLEGRKQNEDLAVVPLLEFQDKLNGEVDDDIDSTRLSVLIRFVASQHKFQSASMTGRSRGPGWAWSSTTPTFWPSSG